MEYGFFGLLVLIANIYAIASIFSSTASTGTKVVWILLVLVLPVIGFVIWFFAGPRGALKVS